MDPATRAVWMPGRVRTEIHVEGSDTGGGFCLLVEHPPAGSSSLRRNRTEARAREVDAHPCADMHKQLAVLCP